jgi:hypothetical protein
VLLEENNARATGALSRKGVRLIMLALSLMTWLGVMVRLIGLKRLAAAMVVLLAAAMNSALFSSLVKDVCAK